MSKKLKIVVAPDSFKESLSSLEVCEALEQGIKSENPSIEVIKAPIADGGEGTVDTLMAVPGSKSYTNTVTGPMGNSVRAKWAIIPDHLQMAVIEMASTSGLTLIQPGNRNPMKATTYGVGELILIAIESGVKEILIGIGGSATNDGGAGMLQALKFKLLDANGQQIPPGNEGISKIASIEATDVQKEVLETKIIVASDVRNPLTGPNGASFVYGPQKGATREMVEAMDKNMKHFAQTVRNWKGKDLSTNPGAGAAGGIGFALLAFLNSDLRSGFEAIADLIGLESKIASADWVLTGEGKLDLQTLQGKGPFGVAQMARKYNKPVIAIGGVIDDQARSNLDSEFKKIYKISPPGTSKEDSMQNTENYLHETGRRIARYISSN